MPLFLKRQLYTLDCIAIRDEAPEIKTFDFAVPKGLRYRAGEYMHLVAPGAELSKEMVRHMSPASAPHEGVLRFTMSMSSGSKYKKSFADFEAGQSTKLFGITGKFTFRGIAPWARVVFIAGGIGITPIRSLILQAQTRGRRRPWTLIHVGKTHIYRDELAKLDNPQIRTDRQGFPAALSQVLRDEPRAYWFVSGSGSFIRDISKTLIERGVQSKNIRTEDFDH